MKPLLLDLFCKAGGAAKGYADAGFEVIGVDHEPQPRYPFPFLEADALDSIRCLVAGGQLLGWRLQDFAVIHASPPCQRYSVATKSIVGLSESHPDLVPETRRLLESTGLPWVIENVIGAPLGRSLLLCGSMFGLLVRRHRVFESNVLLMSPGPCRHYSQQGSYPCGRSNGSARAGERSRIVHVYGQGCSRGDRGLWQRAMGIEWMTMKEMAQAIPPAYTAEIGRQLIRALGE
jgi:DNA (cytosine-5)-methyltransferase 1